MIDFRTKRVLTFDCYGTLVDWERGILEITNRRDARLRLGA